MAGVLTVLEQRDGVLKKVSHEALTAARTLADQRGGPMDAMVVGGDGIDPSVPAMFGAETVYVTSDEALTLYQPDPYAATVVERVRVGGYDVVLLPATALGKDLGPRIAAQLECPLAVDVTSIDGSGDLTVTRPVYSGKAIYTLKITATPCVISLRPNGFSPAESPRTGSVENVSAAAATIRARTTTVKEPETARLDVAEASIVVSGGRGLKDPANFNLIEDLANALGSAAVGASRAVVDAGWRPHADQVGQTGKTVSPQLYVAIGISGAVQHLAGMRTSKVIVAINKDKDAPIFSVADYGIVGDLFEIVPRLTEEVKKARGV